MLEIKLHMFFRCNLNKISIDQQESIHYSILQENF